MGRRLLSMLGSRAARGAVGRMERSMGGARYTSSSLLCHAVDTAPTPTALGGGPVVPGGHPGHGAGARLRGLVANRPGGRPVA